MSENAVALNPAILFKVALETRSQLDPLMPNTEKLDALRKAIGRRWPQASPDDISSALEQLKRDHPGVVPRVED